MWRRLPTWFPNLRLQMMPLTPEQKATLLDTGWLREVAFKCEPRTTKLEIKAFLEAVHNMRVERVNTINYQGKKKRSIDHLGRPHYFRRSDWKKAYVLFEPPPEIQRQWLLEREELQRQRLEEVKQAALQRQRLPLDLPPAAALAVAQDAAPAVKQSAAKALAAAAERRRKAAARRQQWQLSQQQQQQDGAPPGGSSSSSKGSKGSSGKKRT